MILTHLDSMENFFARLLLPIMGLGIAYNGFLHFRRRIQYQNTSTTKISSAAQGLVKLHGYAWPSREFKAPISGALCVYFECEIYNHSSDYVHMVAEKKSTQPFFLLDTTGLVQITPSKTVDFQIGNTTEYNWARIPPERQKALVKLLESKEKEGLAIKWYNISTKLVAKERYIASQCKLSAIGNLNSKFGIQAMPVEGVAVFMNAITKKYDVNGNLDDAQVQNYGRMNPRVVDKLIVADCWTDKFLNRTGGPIKSFFMITGGIVLFLYAFLYSFLK
jgi:hypothetical protein